MIDIFGLVINYFQTEQWRNNDALYSSVIDVYSSRSTPNILG